MIEPGYNEGESPPFWIWVVVLAICLIAIFLILSLL
jgi:hypothetical protein